MCGQCVKEGYPSPYRLMECAEAREVVGVILGKVPREELVALYLYYGKGFGGREIALRVGCAKSTVYKRRDRGAKRLRDLAWCGVLGRITEYAGFGMFDAERGCAELFSVLGV